MIKIYIDDIIFDTINKSLYKDYIRYDADEFEMSIMEEFQNFLRLQMHRLKEDTFINQAKYYKELLTRIGIEKTKKLFQIP